jgi:hypothetical protein
MEFHKDTIDGLRAKEYQVGPLFIRAESDGLSAHQFITVNGIDMPIELAADLSTGRKTLAEIGARIDFREKGV